MKHTLVCLDCGHEHQPSVETLFCPDCGGLFRVQYSDDPGPDFPRLPISDPEDANSLGEGDTPVVSLDSITSELGLGQLWAKLEFMAPTGSFKDRGSAVLTTMGRDMGVSEFVEDSSGNAGASLSAYAAAAKMSAHVFAPASAARGKLDQIQIFGARLHEIDGPRQAATDAAEQFVEQNGSIYMSHNLSPYFSEGMKLVSFELEDVLGNEIEHVVLPVGNGSLLIGMVRGFEELRDAGVIVAIPRFHGIQSESVQPVVAAMSGQAWEPEMAKSTNASGIAVSKPPRLAEMVEAIKSTGGSAIAVSEESLPAWQTRLSRTEGIFAEKTSVAAFSGLQKLIESGVIARNSNVCVPITGSGLKEPLS